MPMKMKTMKNIDLSCASQSSTAICSSIDQHSMIKNSTKTLQRLNTYLAHNYKTLTNNITDSYNSPSRRPPCISELPFTPRPSSYSSYREKTQKHTSDVTHTDVFTRRRSSADIMDMKRYNNLKYGHMNGSKTNSSRYLIGESKYLDSLSDESTRNGCNDNRNTSRVETRRFGSMLEDEKEKIRKHFSLIDVGDDQVKGNLGMKQRNAGGETCCDGQSLKQRNMVKKTALSRDQIVVLRVSLHCRGCENKLRKHLSKMEGVTSYNIEMETKKVTVVGHVTPVEVLSSISKVKNAQFWPSQVSTTSSTSSSSSSSSSTMDFN